MLTISIAFDDGREDTYRNAYKILKKYNLNATIHVITGYVDNSWDVIDMNSSHGSCTINQLLEMKNNGFEISSHGDKHITNFEDLKISIEKLKLWNLINFNVGFALPASIETELANPDFIKNIESLKCLRYIRTGKNLDKLTYFRKVAYVLYQITHLNLFFNLHNIINVNKLDSLNKYKIISLTIRKKDKINSVKKFIKKCQKKDMWILLQFHSILEKKDSLYNVDKWVWDIDKFENLCKFLSDSQKNNTLKVNTIMEVIQKEQ